MIYNVEINDGVGVLDVPFSGFISTICISAVGTGGGNICIRIGCEINTHIEAGKEPISLPFDYAVEFDQIQIFSPNSFTSVKIETNEN